MAISKNIFLVLVLILPSLSSLLFAQETKLKGTVVDGLTLQPLKGANVYLSQTQKGAITDDDGYFELKLDTPGKDFTTDTLVVSFVGYHKYRLNVASFKNRSRIELWPNAIVQDSVTVKADRIDLTAQEIPHARTTVSSQEIEIRGLSEISDVFKTIPSVRVEGNDISGRRIQIRGSNASEVNVYIDGILINNLGIDNSADLSITPTENIESIEVLKGSNLTLLGNGAFGGVVNIKTKKSLDRSLYLKTKQGSFSSQYYISELNLPVSKKVVLNYFGQLNELKPGIEFFPSESFDIDKTENQTVETSKQNHNIRLDYYSSKGEFSAKVYGYLLNYQKLSSQNQPLINDRKNFLFAFSYQGSLFGLNNFDMSMNYLLGDDFRERQQTDNLEMQRFSDSFLTDRLNIKFLKKIVFGKANEIQVLGEYYHDELESKVDLSVGEIRTNIYRAELYENRWSAAGVIAFSNYVNDNPDFSWKTHFGLRGDFLPTGDQYVSPTMGIQVIIEKPKWTWMPYMTVGKNVKFHTLLDNAFIAVEDDITSDDTTLTRLDPEVSNSAEVGISFKIKSPPSFYRDLEIKFAIFRSAIVNKLIVLPDQLYQTPIDPQAGRNVTKGLEGSVGLQGIFNTFDVFASAAIFSIQEPTLYPFKPENMVSLQTVYSSKWGGYFSATWFLEGQSAGYLEQGSSKTLVPVTVPSSFDMDISAGYKFRVLGSRLNLQLSGFNVLDNFGLQSYLLKKQFFQVSLSAKI